jgi:hypothetical protein
VLPSAALQQISSPQPVLRLPHIQDDQKRRQLEEGLRQEALKAAGTGTTGGGGTD